MKVLLISPLPPPEGGIATWTVKYCNYCKEQGICVEVVNCAMIGDRAKQINAKRNVIDEIFRTLFVLRELKKFLSLQNFDIAHLNTSCSRFGIYRDLLCTLYMKWHKVPFVLHCHCNIEDQVYGAIARLALKWMTRTADRVLTLNSKSFGYIEQLDLGKSCIVPNFIEENHLFYRKEIVPAVRRVLYVGHVQSSKGTREIIRAAKKLPKMTFVLIGPVQNKELKQDAPENVIFVGNKDHQYVIEELKKADVFLFPSYTEGFANALLESMAAGLPIVTTPVGANQDMIEEQGGVIVPVGDHTSIVAALEKLEHDVVLRTSMSVWNIQKVRQNYLIDSVMQKLLSVYEEILR